MMFFTDYGKKARNADQKYNGTAAGAVGPIEERLQQFGVVRPVPHSRDKSLPRVRCPASGLRVDLRRGNSDVIST